MYVPIVQYVYTVHSRVGVGVGSKGVHAYSECSPKSPSNPQPSLLVPLFDNPSWSNTIPSYTIHPVIHLLAVTLPLFLASFVLLNVRPSSSPKPGLKQHPACAGAEKNNNARDIQRQHQCQHQQPQGLLIAGNNKTFRMFRSIRNVSSVFLLPLSFSFSFPFPFSVLNIKQQQTDILISSFPSIAPKRICWKMALVLSEPIAQLLLQVFQHRGAATLSSNGP